jgi:hypothetical protein
LDGTLGGGIPIGRLWPFDLLDLLFFAFTCIDADGFAQDITWLDPLFLILMLITPSLYSFYHFPVCFSSPLFYEYYIHIPHVGIR